MNDTTVTVVGTVCSEVRYGQTHDATPTARFQIRQTPRRFDKRTNTWTDGDPSYFSATCFRTLADHVASSMGVGDPVVATGRLRISRWRRGEENMVSAELDVQAIGHDLRWGTTVYRRSTPPGGTRIPGPARRREEEAAAATGSAAAPPRTPELELAGAGVGAAAGAGAGSGAGSGSGAGPGSGAAARVGARAEASAAGSPGSGASTRFGTASDSSASTVPSSEPRTEPSGPTATAPTEVMELPTAA